MSASKSAGVGAQLRDGFARPLVKGPTNFPGASVKLFYSTGDERIVVGHFYRRVTNFIRG